MSCVPCIAHNTTIAIEAMLCIALWTGDHPNVSDHCSNSFRVRKRKLATVNKHMHSAMVDLDVQANTLHYKLLFLYCVIRLLVVGFGHVCSTLPSLFLSTSLSFSYTLVLTLYW